jgi:hypothetical protein
MPSLEQELIAFSDAFPLLYSNDPPALAAAPRLQRARPAGTSMKRPTGARASAAPRSCVVRPSAFATPQPEAAFMDRPVMRPAQQHQICQARGTAIGPVDDVMSVDEAPLRAAREATAPIADAQRPRNRRRNLPCAPPDVQHVALAILVHARPAAVARHPPRRFRGNVGAVFELAAPPPVGRLSASTCTITW